MDGSTETIFLGQAQTRAVYQESDGQSVMYKLCLETQAAHLFLKAPMGRDPMFVEMSFLIKKTKQKVL